MSLTASDRGGADFAPAPQGTHVARCCWVIDLGTQSHPQYGDAYKVLIGWELPNELIEDGDRAGEPFFISNFYTLSLHEKSNLRRDLESWRGRGFTKKELDGFDVRQVAGKPCQITVIHETKNEKTRARVSGVSALPKGMDAGAIPEQVNPTRIFVIEEDNREVFDALPEWVQKKINESKERQRAAPRASEDPGPSDHHVPPEDEEVPF